MSTIELCGEDPRWMHTEPEHPDTIFIGGDLFGMNLTLWHFPDCVIDPRLLDYECMEDYIEDNFESAWSHEVIHLVLNRVEGEVASDMWDNVDGLLQITLNKP